MIFINFLVLYFSFVESQLTYAQAIQASEQKQWDVVIDLGKHAFEKFKEIVENTIADRLG